MIHTFFCFSGEPVSAEHFFAEHFFGKPVSGEYSLHSGIKHISRTKHMLINLTTVTHLRKAALLRQISKRVGDTNGNVNNEKYKIDLSIDTVTFVTCCLMQLDKGVFRERNMSEQVKCNLCM